MSELRNEWTPEQVQANLGEANETLPEARITDRFTDSVRSSGVDVRSGEETYAEDGAAADPGGVFQVPPDPPQRPTTQDGE
jgi:hypothetical protein